MIQEYITTANEQLLGKWTINCIPFSGNRLLGKLYVTDKSLYYNAQYDMSFEGILEQLTTSALSASGHPLLVSQEIINHWKDKGFIRIAKSEIAEVIEDSSFFKKKVTVKLKDDQTIVFDYGLLSVKKLKAAIEE